MARQKNTAPEEAGRWVRRKRRGKTVQVEPLAPDGSKGTERIRRLLNMDLSKVRVTVGI